MEMKTGILCHGRHLGADNWNLHQWGDQKRGLLGQILKTMELAYYENPSVIVFGSGASEKNGKKEAQYIRDYMFDKFERAKEFPQFKNIDLIALYGFMKGRSFLEMNSQNTREELQNSGEIFLSKGVERIILVSNPDHISRCLQLAHKIYGDKKYSLIRQILGAQSDMGYRGTIEVTSAIIEMPHRKNNHDPDLSRSIGKYFNLTTKNKKRFVNLVENFFNEVEYHNL
jgi:DUF218 domain